MSDLLLIKNDPNYNEQWPRALVPYEDIYGVEEPVNLEWLPNDGSLSPYLPAGTPFGLVGTSSFYKRNSAPRASKDNWFIQGSDSLGGYTNDEIYAVRILSMEPSSHRAAGALAHKRPPDWGRNFLNHANEKLRILGEIPLRKANGILDPDGNPDTSFLAKIPADVPFTFQTLDRNGMVLNMAQTWHQVRPGEVRADCGGCHAHAQTGTAFASTVAGQPGFQPVDLTTTTPLLTLSGGLTEQSGGAVDVEYYRDIKPILQSRCVQCHTGGNAKGGLNLDQSQLVEGYEKTWWVLAKADERTNIPQGPLEASKYITKFMARDSLFVTKIFDGHGNLNDGEKMTFVRWVGLGAPINNPDSRYSNFGWFLDDLRPTLTLSLPRAGVAPDPLTMIRIGMFDYYSGLNLQSLSVRADFAVNGRPAGTELVSEFVQTEDHVWTLTLETPLTNLPQGQISVRITDHQGNLAELDRRFGVFSEPNGT